MGLALTNAISRLEARVRARQRLDAGVLDRLRADPAEVMVAGRMDPDPWQAGVLRATAERTLLLCSRQCFDADTVVLDRAGRAMRVCDHPDAWCTGVRPVRRYTVRGGAAVAVTDNHPVWSAGGWVPAGTLKRGDRIAVLSHWDRWPAAERLERDVQHGTWVRPRTTRVAFPLTEDLGRLLGYLATDGSNRPGQSIKFTNTRPAYLAEVERLAFDLTGVAAKRYAKGSGFDLLFTTTKARHDNRLMDLMRSVRWDHRFPTDVFAFPLPAVAAFVNRAWAGDGCVRQGKGGHPEVFLACKDEVYGRYFQLLLMKLGVHGRLTTEWMNKCTRPFHRLVLGGGRLNIERFFSAVGPIYGKEDRSHAVLDYFRRTTKAQDYRKCDHRGEDGEEFHLAPIVKVEDLGPRPVWDVTVPDKGWLVAQGIKAHNSGKSSVSAALAIKTALLEPGSPVLLLSPSQRQSGELFRKVLDLYQALGRPVPSVRETALQLELANGSRVLSLPGTEGTVRGFSRVALLVIDEAARVSDPLYYAVRPMLAVSRGRLVALSTPFGQRGWFHAEWTGGGEFERVRVTADQVPRISKEFLAEERRALGDRWFAQEYQCSFESTVDAVFDYRDIQAALSADVEPLFGRGGKA
jgi:LAGLIDADG-like domain